MFLSKVISLSSQIWNWFTLFFNSLNKVLLTTFKTSFLSSMFLETSLIKLNPSILPMKCPSTKTELSLETLAIKSLSPPKCLENFAIL